MTARNRCRHTVGTEQGGFCVWHLQRRGCLYPKKYGFREMFVKANAGAEDKYYIAGHVFRIISCLNQVLFACNNAYCINEKKAIKLLETFEYKPKKYAERVNHIFEVLGLSLFECYDMTEKLYKEVKKIATEINNFLNEGEFR